MKTTNIVLCFAVLVLCAATAFALEESDFAFDAETGTITRYAGWDTEVAIPAKIGGKPVKIGKEAFEEAELTAVTIPVGVTTIGEYAFRDNKLTDVVIPEGVRTIGTFAFSGNNLASISYPSTLEFSLGFYGGSTVGPFSTPPAKVTLAANILDVNTYAFGRVVCCNYLANDLKKGTYTQNMLCAEKTDGDFTYYETQYGAVISEWNGSGTRLKSPQNSAGSRSRLFTVLSPGKTSQPSRYLIPSPVSARTPSMEMRS